MSKLDEVYWSQSPHDQQVHALTSEVVAAAAGKGHAGTLCGHTVPFAGMALSQKPFGEQLCLPCATKATEGVEVPDETERL